MSNRMIVSALSIGALFMSVSLFGQPTTTIATNGFVPLAPQLPPVGLASSETAQVNILNTAAGIPGGVAPSCTGTVAFYNASGAVTGSVTNFAVGTGQIFSVTLPYASTGASGARTVIRAAVVLGTITATLGTAPSLAPCALSSSLETWDTATGVTHIFVSGTAGQQGPIAVIRSRQFVPPLP